MIGVRTLSRAPAPGQPSSNGSSGRPPVADNAVTRWLIPALPRNRLAVLRVAAYVFALYDVFRITTPSSFGLAT